MKRILLPILAIGILLLGACGGTTTTLPTTHTLSVSVSPPGAGSVSPPGGEYEPGLEVTLTATPASGYTFDYWDGGASGSAATITITMDSNKSITAHFKTVETIPPVISDVAISLITDSTATISWVTDEPATSQVEYGTTSSYGDTTSLDEELTTSHSATLTELNPDTTYHFKVKSVDKAGNISVSGDSTFITKSLEELLSATFGASGVVFTSPTGDRAANFKSLLHNDSSQTITVTKVEIFDEHGNIFLTISGSDIVESGASAQVDAGGESFLLCISFGILEDEESAIGTILGQGGFYGGEILPFTRDLEDWQVKWYCSDSRGNELIVMAECWL